MKSTYQSKNEVRLEKNFSVPVNVLFAACARPEFFLGCGVDLKSGHCDFWRGGKYDFKINGCVKDDFCRGEFLEIVVDQKISFTWESRTGEGLTGRTLVEFEFLSLGEKQSRIKITHSGFATATAAKDHQEGWDHIFSEVAEKFSKQIEALTKNGPRLGFSFSQRFNKPVAAIFSSFVQPDQITKFFVAETTGPLRAGDRVRWRFKDHGSDFYINCYELTENKRIRFSWGDSKVIFDFEEIDADHSRMTVHCSGYQQTQQGIEDSYSECEGWREVMLALKMRLEYNINIYT